MSRTLYKSLGNGSPEGYPKFGAVHKIRQKFQRGPERVGNHKICQKCWGGHVYHPKTFGEECPEIDLKITRGAHYYPKVQMGGKSKIIGKSIGSIRLPESSEYYTKVRGRRECRR